MWRFVLLLLTVSDPLSYVVQCNGQGMGLPIVPSFLRDNQTLTIQNLTRCCEQKNQGGAKDAFCNFLGSSTALPMVASYCQGKADATQPPWCDKVEEFISPITNMQDICGLTSQDNTPAFCENCGVDSALLDCVCQCEPQLEQPEVFMKQCTANGSGPACSAMIPAENTSCWCSSLLNLTQVKTECKCNSYSECEATPGICLDANADMVNPESQMEACMQDPGADFDPEVLLSDTITVAICCLLLLPGLGMIAVLIVLYLSKQFHRTSRKFEIAFRHKSREASTLKTTEMTVIDEEELDEIGRSSTIGKMVDGMGSSHTTLGDEGNGGNVTMSLEVACLNFFVPEVAFKARSKQQGFLRSIASTTVNTLASPFKKRSYKQLLFDVSCSFKPGTLTAIMGPSGAGKTTLLNILSGRVKSGQFSGQCLLNGQALKRGTFNAVMAAQGYVLQQDCFLEWLTVKEWMFYEAMLRLPDSMTTEKKMERAMAALSEVDLLSAGSTKIGGVTCKGISGGQKRRLSIAVELLRLPAILLCDEPTSGLDATSSLKVVQLLKNLSQQGAGRTVVTTIHQPRAEIIALFDNVLLLGKGGYIIFLGPVKKAVKHLQRLVTQNADRSPSRSSRTSTIGVEQYDNPADFLIDVVGLDPESQSELGIDTRVMVDAWDNSQIKAKLIGGIRENHLQSKDDTPITKEKSVQAGKLTQIWVLFSRRIACTYNSPGSYLPNLITIVAVTIIVANAFSYKDATNINTAPYEQLMFLFCVSSYTMILQYLIMPPIYYDERAVLRASRASRGSSILSYVIGCSLEELASATLQVVVMQLACWGPAPFHLNSEPGYAFFNFTMLLIGVLAFQSVIAWVTMITDSLATAYNLIFLILAIGSLFGGLFVTHTHIPWYFQWAYWGSIPMITFRSLILNNFQCCDHSLSVNCKEFRTYIFSLEAHSSSKNGSKSIFAESGFSDVNETAFAEDPYYCFDTAERDHVYSGEGNLGRYYLSNLGFQEDNKFLAIWICIAVALLFRLLAVVTFKGREWYSYKLVERDTDEAKAILSGSIPPDWSPGQKTSTTVMNSATPPLTSVFGMTSTVADDNYEDASDTDLLLN
eukprot:m.190976 g.190976  ORF g.190976 m.190976 type:complete len:1096 (-) comp32416_c0_seq2:146-3433(-)